MTEQSGSDEVTEGQNHSHEDALYFNHWLENALENFAEDLKSDDDQIDNDHRALLELAFQLNDAILANSSDLLTGVIINKLNRYMREHFAAEEMVMSEIGYPGLAAHRREHQMLTTTYEMLVEEYKSGHRHVETLHSFLREFVLSHIPRADRPLIHWMRNHKGRR